MGFSGPLITIVIVPTIEPRSGGVHAAWPDEKKMRTIHDKMVVGCGRVYTSVSGSTSDLKASIGLGLPACSRM